MELVKQPETEVEYWEAIKTLGGYIWRTSHDLSYGREEIEKRLQLARQQLERLTVEIGEKFGVIDPKNCPEVEFGQTPSPAPDGKKYYWDWYEQMKQDIYRKKYEGLICSACPLSDGLEHMVALGGVIPCGVWSGTICCLCVPYQCAMTDRGNWSETKLHEEIVKKAGRTALAQFQKKEKELRDKLAQKPQ